MTLILGAAVVVLAVVAVVRRVDVRLALFLAALTLGGLAGRPMAIVYKFLSTFADEKFLVPIGTAMGFAYVLRHTGCDRHLVHLLVRPLQYVRGLLIPGTVVVGYLVNIPVVSQTSTAVTIGAVLVPLLQAARISPATTGAALLLGSSLGGELLNPGAPELRTVVKETADAARRLQLPGVEPTGRDCVAHVLPLGVIQLGVVTAAFWVLSLRAEARYRKQRDSQAEAEETPSDAVSFRVNPLRAAVPMVPLVLLFLTGPPFEVLHVPRGWLVDRPDDPADLARFDSRLVGAAMLVGTAVATLTAPRAIGGVVAAFCEGAGYAFQHIISLIVSAACFGEGIKQIGLARLIGKVIEARPGLLLPGAGALPLGFSLLCGSGMAATQALFGFFAEPALQLGLSPVHVGAVVSIAAAAGRTMSPVAAVTLMCAAMTQTDPVTLARRVAGPLLLSTTVVVVVAMLLAQSG
jgi:DcuC family C4-dicarboxylate transporter